VGKTTCARIFAKAINCLNPQGGEACNECESCRSFNEGRSLNVHELDAASNNSVDDIRNLIEQVRIIPQQGSYSVFVIDEVHMLSAAAFNAFLKTLEEPPRHAIFILATTEKHKIIPTILSRCQIYDFNRIKVEDGVEYLRYIANKEGVTADDEALNLIAHKADGGMRDALSMFDKAVSFCGNNLNYKDVASTLNVLDYDTYFSVTELLLAGNYVETLLRFDEVLSRGFSPQVFIAGLNAHFRDLLMAKGPAVSLIEVTGTLVERYKEQAVRCSEQFLFTAISLLTEADGKIRQSSNQRLLVELGLMKIAGLGQKKNEGIDNLVEFIEGIVETSFDTSIQLPPLDATIPVPQSAQPQPQAPAPQTVVTVTRPLETTQPESVAPSVQPQPEEPQRAVRTGRSPRLPSLTGLLRSEAKSASEIMSEQEALEARITSHIDPYCEEKLSTARDKIVERVTKYRKRLGVIFDSMTIEGNTITVTVASEGARDEIYHEKSDLQKLIAQASGVKGLVEIAVTVNEQIRVARPITLEDRLRHLVTKNDKLLDMIEKLGLDAE
jgi:DNA polymerase-3 subunit gamma/tau